MTLLIESLELTLSNRTIVQDITLNVDSGEVVGLLGPNGAGKTSTFNMIVGLIKPRLGSIYLDKQSIIDFSMTERVRLGIGYLAQEPSVFRNLTVRENLEIGGFLREEGLDQMIENIYDLFPILSEKKSQIVGQLSGGQRQQVALGRALMSEPSVLMLDEPTAGVSPIVMDELFEHIIKVKKTNVAIIMVEQNAKQALSISDRGYVLVTGQNKFEGSGEELLNDPEVRRSFLGG